MSRREVGEDGTVRYFNSSNELHREDGPAVEWANGRKSWFIDGIYIRHSTTNHFAKLSQLSLRCFSFELFEYREIEDLVSEGLGVNQYRNFREIVRVGDE